RRLRPLAPRGRGAGARGGERGRSALRAGPARRARTGRARARRGPAAAQEEPRPAPRGLRSRPELLGAAPRPRGPAGRRRRRAAVARAAVRPRRARRVSGPRRRRRARRALPARGLHRLPLAVRGLRPAGARGHGLRHARHRQPPGRGTRGARRGLPRLRRARAGRARAGARRVAARRRARVGAARAGPAPRGALLGRARRDLDGGGLRGGRRGVMGERLRVLVDACMLDGLPSGAATRAAALGAALAARGRVQAVHLVRPGLDPLPGLECLPCAGLQTPWQRLNAGPRLRRLLAAQQGALLAAGALPLPTLSGAAPIALTLHDLRFLEPTSGASAARRLWARHRLGPNLARAARIVAVSRSTADELVARELYPAERIAVVPNAGTPGLQRVDDPARLAAFRRAAGLNRRYALALGPLEAHKQPGFLLAVLAALGSGPAADLALVFAGRAEPSAAQALRRRAAALGLEERVHVLGLLEG